MENKLIFDAESVEIVQIDAPQYFTKLLVKIVKPGQNAHNLPITPEAIDAAKSSLIGKPILASIKKGDFQGHNPDEIPVGITALSEDDIFYDGEYLASYSYIWKRYFDNAVEIFRNSPDNKVEVSMEIDLTSYELRDNTTWITGFLFSGVTLLGKSIKAAISGADATVVEFTRLAEEFEHDKQILFSSQKLTHFPRKGHNKPISLVNSLHPEFDYEYATDLKTSYPSIWNKGGLSHSEQHFSMWSDAHSGKSSPAIEDWIRSREQYAERHSRERSISGNMGLIKRGITSDFGLETMKVLLDTEKKSEDKKNKAYFGGEDVTRKEFAKEDLGKGSALKVDKSKDKVSDTAWGSINKTELEHKVLDASNYASLVHDVYLVVDAGYEDHPSSSLHFPCMQLIGDTFVYNKGGLSAALGRAKGQNMDSLASKIVGIQKKLGLEGGDSEKESNKEVKEKMADEEEVKPKEEMAAPPEDKKAEADKEEKETPQEEKDEPKAEQDKEKQEGTEKPVAKKAKMSEFCDLEKMSKFVADTEFAKEFAAEADKEDNVDFGMVVKACYAAMCKMSDKFDKSEEDKNAYMEKMQEYEARFAELEKQKFSMAVESLLKDESIAEYLSKDDIVACREDSVNFSLETISGWENKVKALAFTKTKGKKPVDSVVKYALAWDVPNPKSGVDTRWDA